MKLREVASGQEVYVVRGYSRRRGIVAYIEDDGTVVVDLSPFLPVDVRQAMRDGDEPGYGLMPRVRPQFLEAV